MSNDDGVGATHLGPDGAALKAALSARGFELRETHASWVFLDATSVYKIKKPVQLGFLDFSTLPLRERACHDEVRLNKRLAPDVYLGVVPITAGGAAGDVVLGGTGKPIEFAVHMRRLADSSCAQMMLAEGSLTSSHVELLAARLSTFHRTCATGPEIRALGGIETLERNIDENFRQTESYVLEYLQERDVQAIRSGQLGFLEDGRALLAQRLDNGFVRDGHGDLRLEHVYFESDGVVVIDCIEFNDRFRYGDVCADVAFLAMDLAYQGQAHLSETLIASYARESNDYDIYGLVDFYASYRAYVRAKVTSMLERQRVGSRATRDRLHGSARRFFVLAAAEFRPPLDRPVLVVVFGKIASGKSTLAQALGHEMAVPVLSSDRTRKWIAQVSPETPLTDSPYRGSYDAQVTGRVYDEVVRRTDRVLASGRAAVVDATCSQAQQRRRFADMARVRGVPVLFVECLISDGTCRERLRARAQGPSVSDGRLSILDDFLARYQSPNELRAGRLLRIQTERVDAALVRTVLSHPALGA